jgi:hypothetical protein
MFEQTHGTLFDRVLEDVGWACYAACLRADHRTLTRIPVPESATAFLTSPLVAATVLARRERLLADRARCMALHESQLREIRSWSPGMWRRLSPEDRQAWKEDAKTYECYLVDHRERMSYQPHRLDLMLAWLQQLYPWIWAHLSVGDREELLVIADLCRDAGCLQDTTPPPYTPDDWWRYYLKPAAESTP